MSRATTISTTNDNNSSGSSSIMILSPRNLNTKTTNKDSTIGPTFSSSLMSGENRNDILLKHHHCHKRFYVSSSSSEIRTTHSNYSTKKCFNFNSSCCTKTNSATALSVKVPTEAADLVGSSTTATTSSSTTPLGKRKPSVSQCLLPQTPPRTTTKITTASSVTTTTTITSNNKNGNNNTGITTTTAANSFHNRTPISKRERNRALYTPSPSKSSSDRYIPNRAYLDVNICRDVIVTEEKKLRRSSSANNNNNNANSNSSGNEPTEDSLTPLQAEFNLRMRGALLNVPFYNSSTTSTSAASTNSISSSRIPSSDGASLVGNNTGSGNSQIFDGTNPTNNTAIGPPGNNPSTMIIFDPFRTVATSDIDPAYRLMNNESSKENSSSLLRSSMSSERLLTFRSDMSPATTTTAAASNTTSSVPSTSTTTTSSPLRNNSNNNNTIIPDPYLQDQLRVLNRTYGRRNTYRQSSSSSLDMVTIEEATLRSVAKKVGRKISSVPIRILDAPNLVDDYYLNLVSWSADNILAVALGQSVYLWYAATEQIDHLLTLTGSDDYVTSVCWCNQDGNTNYIAVGTNDATVQLWDASTLQKVRTLRGHSGRVGSLAWNRHHWLSSGSRDSSIIQHDVRIPQNRVATYIGHTQEVCGLKWSYDGSTLASGGNENFLCLWDASMSSGRSRHPSNNNYHNDTTATTVSARVILTHHKAAVKALAWCPFHRGVLASGGGTADRSIKFWNTNSGALLNTVDTGSQVCSLLWSTHNKEICSSHGFSEYQLILWKYPSMAKIQEFTGHHARVLHMEPSPDGSCVVSAAADETLRFWDIFGSAPNKNTSARSLLAFGGGDGIGHGGGGMALSLR